MERNLAVGATSGSVSAILLRLLGSVLETPTLPCDCDCDCPLCTDLPQLIIQKLDIFSLLVGILCGLCICPVLDLTHLIRQSWVVWLRSCKLFWNRKRLRVQPEMHYSICAMSSAELHN